MAIEDHSVKETPKEPLQLLTFLLDKEVFSMEIGQVQEVLEYTHVTPVPRTPGFMLGVINLRGSVVPVIDMRQQFDMPSVETTIDSCIVITEIELDGEKCPIGLLADAVKEVIELDLDQINPAPRIGSVIDTQFIMGIGKHDGNFVIILDLPRIFSSTDLEEVVSTTPSSVPDKENTEEGSESGEH